MNNTVNKKHHKNRNNPRGDSPNKFVSNAPKEAGTSVVGTKKTIYGTMVPNQNLIQRKPHVAKKSGTGLDPMEEKKLRELTKVLEEMDSEHEKEISGINGKGLVYTKNSVTNYDGEDITKQFFKKCDTPEKEYKKAPIQLGTDIRFVREEERNDSSLDLKELVRNCSNPKRLSELGVKFLGVDKRGNTFFQKTKQGCNDRIIDHSIRTEVLYATKKGFVCVHLYGGDIKDSAIKRHLKRV